MYIFDICSFIFQSDIEIGEKHPCDHQSGRNISPRELRCGGSCGPIRMDLFSTHDKRHGIRIRKSVEASSGNIFPLYFLWKIKISTTHSSNLKYDSGQEIRTMPTRPGDISQQEMPKSDMSKNQADWSQHRKKRISHLLSPTGAQVKHS